MILKKDNLMISLSNDIQIAAYISSGWKPEEPKDISKKKRADNNRPASEKV